MRTHKFPARADSPPPAPTSAAEVAVGVTIRLLAFTGLVCLAVQLRTGRNWARIALAVLYGGFGPCRW